MGGHEDGEILREEGGKKEKAGCAVGATPAIRAGWIAQLAAARAPRGSPASSCIGSAWTVAIESTLGKFWAYVA